MDSGTLNIGGTFTAAASRTHTIASGGGAIDVDSGQTYSLNAANQLTGSGALSKHGQGTLTLGNAMNFSGSLAISAGVVRFTSNDLLGDNVPISIAAGATLDLNNNSDTLGPLSFTGGTAQSRAGVLTLNGNVTGNASSTMATVSGNLSLGASTRIFNIAEGGAHPDMNVTASISGGASGLIKTGTGTLQISGANSYTGETDLQQGTLLLGAGSSVLQFDASQSIGWTGGTFLTIANWSGSTSGGGTDRVIFGSADTALTSSQVAQIRFLDPFGAGSGLIAARILPTGEVVPIPEPATVFSAAALAAFVSWRERKRIAQWFVRK
ncbi:MAG: hypothetical protein FJ404_16755 [Verrucomicrobia bacterium]|nr:hypothetical protein [Verrucomicrobiota bacterium]